MTRRENWITPTAHERQEWARMAADCERAGKAIQASAFKAASILDLPMAPWTYDALQKNYRLWLTSGIDAMPDEGFAL